MPSRASKPRIGVFVCDCMGQIADYLDVLAVTEAARGLSDVGFVEHAELLCGEAKLGAAVRKLADADCERMLFVGCSPRSSLKFPEERIARTMQVLGMTPELFEVANIREQCAWQHSDRDAATRKAIDLTRMAHARLLHDEAAPARVPIPRRALVVGGGAAGLQTARDLDAAGIEVTLVEKQSYLGGRLCQLPRIFQSEAWPSVCDSVCVGPVQAKSALLGTRIYALTQTEVTDVQRRDGLFSVTFSLAPQYVAPELCIACDKCTEVCPEETPRRFDVGMTMRKAIDKEFERAVPDVYGIVEEACTWCSDCVPVCPTEAIELDAKGDTVTDEFGAVFLATGFDTMDLAGYPALLSSHPNVVTSLELERLLARGLKRPSDGEEPERILFVQCAGSRAGPSKQVGGVSYCSKTCCAVTAKQVDRVLAALPMAEPTVVYYRDMRTYERALEELYNKLEVMGVDFVNGEVTEIHEKEGGTLALAVEPLGCGDEDEADSIELEADLVVLAAAQTPARGALELCERFGVRVDRHGFPVESQPRLFCPTESTVSRVFVVGASSGPKVVQQCVEQGSAAAMRALPTLLDGAARPSRYASRVSSKRCIRCQSCVAVCPHGAIRMREDGAHSDPAFCQACGFCAAACPVHAAELTSFSDRQILDQVEVAFRELPEGEPRILALLCYWCAYSAADFAGIERAEAISNHRVIRIRCGSSVNTALIFKMLTLGVDGILVAGCPEKSCHHLWGNFVADKRIELARATMKQLGLDPTRLRFEYIGAPMQEKLREVLASMDAALRKLGPVPVARGVA